MAQFWDDPVHYCTNQSEFGTTNEEIQYNVKKAFNDKGIRLLVSAFGATEQPDTQGADPLQCANDLADYVIKNHLDGADIDYEDSGSFVHGTGEEWLIKFTKQLRKRLPDRLITHAPQAPYFEESTYKNGAYMTIHREVGDLIDFYNVQFYNQGLKRTYDSYYSLFVSTDPY